MNDAAETITTQNTSVIGCRHNCSRPPWLRRRERQRSMWFVPVVVIDERLKRPFKVLLVQNQEAVETFCAGGAHEPLGNPIRLWCATRRPNDLNALASKHVVKTVAEFLIPVADQKPHRFRAFCQRP